ncbi:MAG TPA: S8 family peptidase [Bryobacteraceae bacterium]|jgi:serine protease AprX
MKRLTCFALLFAFAGTGFADQKWWSGSNDHKFGADVKNTDSNANVTTVIQFYNTPSNALLKAIGVNGNGNLKNSFKQFKGGVFTIPAGQLKKIADMPEVKFISLDRVLRAKLDTVTASTGADLARQYGFTGKGVGVAILDSGVNDNVADLKDGNNRSRVVYSESFIGSGSGDPYGHGTHVAGIIGSNGSNSKGKNRTFRGIAPDVQIVSLRVLDENGVGTDAAVIAAIDRAIELKNLYNIRVLNLSVGRPVLESYDDDPLCDAVEDAWKAGIVVVVSAGNDGRDNSMGNQGYGTITSPGNDPYVITVGAMKTAGTAARGDDAIASYSSKGPTLGDHFVKPDLVAPGNRVVSLRSPGSMLDRAYPLNDVWPIMYGAGLGYPVYYTMSGTSMAAPVVSGAAALLLQKDPTLTPDQVKARLMKTASKAFPTTTSVYDAATRTLYTSQYDIFTIGAGYLDITAALNSSEKARGSAVSPVAVYDPKTKKVRILPTATVAGETVAWLDSVAWGESVVFGASLVDSVAWGESVSVAWGETVAWGQSTIAGFDAIWSSSVAWGDNSAVQEKSVAANGEQ